MTASSIEPPISDLVHIHVAGSAPSVRVIADGEIDSTSAPVLRERLDTLLDDGVNDLVVDLTGVSFLDSAGLCVLAATYRRMSAANQRMRVLAQSRAVIRPLQITGLYELLQVETVDAGAVGAA